MLSFRIDTDIEDYTKIKACCETKVATSLTTFSKRLSKKLPKQMDAVFSPLALEGCLMNIALCASSNTKEFSLRGTVLAPRHDLKEKLLQTKVLCDLLFVSLRYDLQDVDDYEVWVSYKTKMLSR
jgi:hypothetical protein